MGVEVEFVGAGPEGVRGTGIWLWTVCTQHDRVPLLCVLGKGLVIQW